MKIAGRFSANTNVRQGKVFTYKTNNGSESTETRHCCLLDTDEFSTICGSTLCHIAAIMVKLQVVSEFRQ